MINFCRVWRHLLLDYRHYFNLSAIGTDTSACLIFGDDLRLSLIIRRVTGTVKHKTAKTCFWEVTHEKTSKRVKNMLRQATQNSSDLSFGTNFSHSQSRKTIPLNPRHWWLAINVFFAHLLMRILQTGKKGLLSFCLLFFYIKRKAAGFDSILTCRYLLFTINNFA